MQLKRIELQLKYMGLQLKYPDFGSTVGAPDLVKRLAFNQRAHVLCLAKLIDVKCDQAIEWARRNTQPVLQRGTSVGIYQRI